MFKSILVTVIMVGSVSSFALDKKVRAEIDSEVKQACSAEIAKAGCGDKSVGTGLMKCLKSYKKDHKDFEISQGCKDVKKKTKEMRKEAKGSAPIAPPVK